MADVLALGVDAGGTKTDAIVCDGAGAVLGYGRSGRGNWEHHGLDAALGEIQHAVGAALAAARVERAQLAASCFAIAGLDWPEDERRLDAGIEMFALGGRRLLVNDSFGALRAGCRQPHGCVSNAGTGGVAAGRNRAGETARTMAVGPGEAGGAYGIVEAAIEAIARSRNGLDGDTVLGDRFSAALGLESTDEFFRRLSREGLQPGSELAPIVLAAATEGDRAAVDVTVSAGDRHAETVLGVARRLGMLDDRFELIRSGSIHLAGHALFDVAFCGRIAREAPGADMQPLRAPPAVGAALLALELIEPVDAPLHDRLVAAATHAREAAA